MGSKNFVWLLAGIALILPFFLIHSTANAAQEKTPAKKTAKPSDTNTVINDFCNRRITKEERSFCSLVFEPNPQTRTIKDNIGLLRIGIQFALGNAMKTQDFLRFLSEDKATSPTLKPVLGQCINAYSDYIKDLEIIIGDLEDDPPMASYDTRMASEALSRCHNSLTTSKTYDDSILGRTNVAVQYSKLIEEISKIV